MNSDVEGHTIVCGTSQMAQIIVEQLVRKRLDVVLIDDDEKGLEEVRRRFRSVTIIKGAATDEIQLAKANVLDASFVVAAMPSDVDNLLIAITCLDLGSDISVYAKSNDATIGNRMRKAGVREVISPSELCGSRVASLILDTEAGVGCTD